MWIFFFQQYEFLELVAQQISLALFYHSFMMDSDENKAC